MAKSGPIAIIEDDIDDQEIIRDVIREIGVANEIIFFDKGTDAFSFLKSTPKQPFIILCDINLPEINGLELKSQMDTDNEVRQKSVPFIFFSTAANKSSVTEAFTKMTVQGFFQKSYNMQELKHTLTIIMEYWKLCKHPNAKF